MKIIDKFKKGSSVLSFEVFPPKKTSPIESIYNTLEDIGKLNPDFISVTYGAGGNVADTRTIDIAENIKKKHGIETLVHLTCVSSTKESVDKILDDMKQRGLTNILALRGDIPDGVEPTGEFKYASDLVEYIKMRGGFHMSGACYPEVHYESKNMIEDIKNLKIKVDAGVEHLMTQLFFDNNVFYDFLEKVRISGIDVPIEAGIMPVTNKKQIERMVSMCGASLPSKFTKIMQKYENNPEALRDAGIAYAIDQIIDLAANDVDGVHIYTMNNSLVSKKIYDGVASIMGK